MVASFSTSAISMNFKSFRQPTSTCFLLEGDLGSFGGFCGEVGLDGDQQEYNISFTVEISHLQKRKEIIYFSLILYLWEAPGRTGKG